jgi:hypothetical protein
VGLFPPKRQRLKPSKELLRQLQQKRTLKKKKKKKKKSSWSAVARKEPKGVLTRCRGYKTALWQKMVFKVNLD